MQIAYTVITGLDGADRLLADLAGTLGASGWRTCGVVQVNVRTWDDHRCDMDVQVLPAGQTIRISQSLGRMAKGCRLDPSALAQAVADTEAQLSTGADVLIINKFGKHEAEGRGFRGLIAEALGQGVPVVLSVNEKNLGGFLAFSQGLATQVAADVPSLRCWLETLSGKTQAA